jgi:hypothetical protein
MNNPWIDLPFESPFVIKDDWSAIEDFNSKNKQSDYEIKTSLFPEPYIGNLGAHVVLLGLNPGYSGNADELDFTSEYFKGLCRDNLLHEKNEYPLYYFNPKLNHTSGYKWWKQKLREVICEAGARTVANELLVLEYFPIIQNVLNQ